MQGPVPMQQEGMGTGYLPMGTGVGFRQQQLQEVSIYKALKANFYVSAGPSNHC